MAELLDQVEIHPALAEVLRSDRESLNQRFALRQRAGAKIDDQAFQGHLRTTINDLVAAVADVLPERVRAVVNGLFDVSLDLFAAGLLGRTTKHPHVQAAWQEVLPQATRLLARDPTRVAGCLSNGADHLAAHSAARPAEWIERLRDVSPLCDSVPQWLDAGKVAAWRAGLVQYRDAALRIVRQLPWKIAATCVSAPDNLTEAEWRQQLDRLEADRWFAPAIDKATGPSPALRIARTIGGFRGFGGPCLRPPKASAIDGRLFVSDGDATWQLLADAFGTMWHRVLNLPSQPKDIATLEKIVMDARGRISWDGSCGQFVELAEACSFACDGQTLAVTLPTSHLVYLVARASS
jgi:hypothetical protein